MNYLAFFYAIFILIGGIMGHARAGSTVSLIMGIFFGLLLLVAAGGMHAKRLWGSYLAIGLTFILDAFFTWRYFSTGKFNPPGVLAFVSFAVLTALVLHFQEIKKKQPFK